MNKEVELYNKLLECLKDTNPKIRDLLIEKEVDTILESINDSDKRKKFLALIAIMTSGDHRQMLIEVLKRRMKKNGCV